LRVPEGLQTIANVFKQFVLEIGCAKVDERKATTDILIKDVSKEDDSQFIKDMLFLHDKYFSMVNTEFEGNNLFQRALKESFVELMNRDLGKEKIPELLANYCDRLLKSNSSEKLNSYDEIEAQLEKTVQLFSYLSDKDFFAEIYRNLLAKRLLSQRSGRHIDPCM
jgi:cullin 1